MKDYSDHAVDRLLELYNNHANQIGSHSAEVGDQQYKGFQKTDCITYVRDVVLYAFRALKQESDASAVDKELARTNALGTKLAAYLVDHYSWVGVYVNPDAMYADDTRNNPIVATNNVHRTGRYYGVPVRYEVVDYSPEAIARLSSGQPGAPGAETQPAETQPVQLTMYERLQDARFGVGCSFGGTHTWLYSEGFVYEVHWAELPTGNLYAKTELRTFSASWKTSVIVLPPDAVRRSKLSMAPQLLVKRRK